MSATALATIASFAMVFFREHHQSIFKIKIFAFF